MQQARHILCIHLPRWSINRWCRRHPDRLQHPLAVIHSNHQRRVVVQACDRALVQGVRPGISAAEARALCPGLIVVDHQPQADHRALLALGRWMIRFTPDVSAGWDDAPDSEAARVVPALLLDLTGCERLFGGIQPILQQARAALDQFQITASLAIAPTTGAAWAFAITHPAGNLLVEALELPRRIIALPVGTLRLEAPILQSLQQLGLQSIGDLLLIPRAQLLARFGPSLLLRLDQLMGDHPEPLTRLITQPPITARVDSDAAIESPQTLVLIFEQLLDKVLVELIRRQHGARRLRMLCTPDRGWNRPPVTRSIALSRPHRDRSMLLHLLRCEIERIDCEHGFVRFQLDIPLHEPISDVQIQLFDQQHEQEQIERDRLLERLRARLGAAAVIRPELVESYIPERAWRPADNDTPAQLPMVPPPRPLTVFQMPVEIKVVAEPCDDRTGQPLQFIHDRTVHRIRQAIGPERISGEWWRGHHRTRDYYEVEDEHGRRYWIFRVLHLGGNSNITARWFLHGRFD